MFSLNVMFPITHKHLGGFMLALVLCCRRYARMHKGNSYESKSNCCETYGILYSERFLDAFGGLLAMRQLVYGDASQNNFSIHFKD